MWFWLSLIALLCWSGSDLFSKIGCQSETDKYSHLKMVTAVGVVMGLHAAYEIFIGGTQVTWEIIWTYLPVSLLYISSMAMGYIGLRYIELSISSPICNSSGALVAVLCLITGGMGELVPAQLVAYELTFLLAGIVCFVYVVLIRKQKLIARQEAPKYAGAAFETAGQFAYIFALSDTAHVAISAPIISAYCVASVVWSRIFLKEKLSLKHYLMIALVVAGIVILGVYDA